MVYQRGRIMDQPEALSLSEAQRLLDEAIAERGEDYVDPRAASLGGRCVYRTYHFNDETPDGPDCGVGCVLFKHGYTLEDLEALDDANDGIGIPACAINSVIPGVLTLEAQEFLQDFQAKQDQGATWGKARTFAYLELALRRGDYEEAKKQRDLYG